MVNNSHWCLSVSKAWKSCPHDTIKTARYAICLMSYWSWWLFGCVIWCDNFSAWNCSLLCLPCILVLWLLWIKHRREVGRLVNGFPILVYYIGLSICQWLSHDSLTEHLHPISHSRRGWRQQCCQPVGKQQPLCGEQTRGADTAHLQQCTQVQFTPFAQKLPGLQELETLCTFEDLKI